MNDRHRTHWFSLVLAGQPWFSRYLSTFNGSSPRVHIGPAVATLRTSALTWCSLHLDSWAVMEAGSYCETRHKNFSVASACRAPQLWVPSVFSVFHLVRLFAFAVSAQLWQLTRAIIYFLQVLSHIRSQRVMEDIPPHSEFGNSAQGGHCDHRPTLLFSMSEW